MSDDESFSSAYSAHSSVNSDFTGVVEKILNAENSKNSSRKAPRKSPHRSKKRKLKRRVFNSKMHTRVKRSDGRLGRLVSNKRHSNGEKYTDFWKKK